MLNGRGSADDGSWWCRRETELETSRHMMWKNGSCCGKNMPGNFINKRITVMWFLFIYDEGRLQMHSNGL